MESYIVNKTNTCQLEKFYLLGFDDNRKDLLVEIPKENGFYTFSSSGVFLTVMN